MAATGFLVLAALSQVFHKVRGTGDDAPSDAYAAALGG